MTEPPKEKYIEDCHPPIVNSPTRLTDKEKEEFISELIKKHKEKNKRFYQPKLMYLQYAQPKQINKNIFYLLAFTFIFAIIPSLYIEITLTKAIGTFFASFLMVINFYDGFIWKDTIVAHTD